MYMCMWQYIVNVLITHAHYAINVIKIVSIDVLKF